MSPNQVHRIDLMIIGAQKSGTTSLLRYLGEHPQLNTHPANEFSFYFDDAEFEEGQEKAFKRYYGKGYRTDKKTIAKHAHLYCSEKAIGRLKSLQPDCKIVLLLRNPVIRAYSSYLMEKSYDRVSFEFDEIPSYIEGKKNMEEWLKEAILNLSQYDTHLENVYRIFPKEQIRVILFEHFSTDPLPYCREIFEWINVDPDFFPRVRLKHNETSISRSKMYSGFLKKFLVEKNPVKEGIKKILPDTVSAKLGNKLRDANRSGKSYPPMTDKTNRYLREYFKEHNRKIHDICGADTSIWN